MSRTTTDGNRVWWEMDWVLMHSGSTYLAGLVHRYSWRMNLHGFTKGKAETPTASPIKKNVKFFLTNDKHEGWFRNLYSLLCTGSVNIRSKILQSSASDFTVLRWHNSSSALKILLLICWQFKWRSKGKILKDSLLCQMCRLSSNLLRKHKNRAVKIETNGWLRRGDWLTTAVTDAFVEYLAW